MSGIPWLTARQLDAATKIVAALMRAGHISLAQPKQSVEFVWIEDVP